LIGLHPGDRLADLVPARQEDEPEVRKLLVEQGPVRLGVVMDPTEFLDELFELILPGFAVDPGPI
jgi:hypothetical protein